MKIQRRRLTRKRRGFTLMELLLVMAILVIMASMVGFAFLGMQQDATSDAARSQISMLKMACKTYKMKVLTFPNKLQDLVEKPANVPPAKWARPFLDLDTLPANKQIVDPWGNPYIYSKDEKNNRVFITSAGPDGAQNTEDDVPRADEVAR
jgi:general secretion pathway protein G